MVYILFIAGFVILIFGANYLVNGASSLGKKFKVSSIIIGLTIVALGTSLPELIISIMASAQGKTDLAISNILGSNIINVFIIVGIVSIISPITINKETTWKIIPFSLLAALLLGVCANDVFFEKSLENSLSTIDGIVFLLFFILFLYYSFDLAKKHKGEINEEVKEYSMFNTLFFIAIGIIGLFVGGSWIVNGSIEVARLLGLSESQIGMSIVAFATSLPELATSVVAAAKRNTDVAIGNAIGSNIFNIFLILGISTVLTPLPFKNSMNIYLGMVILSNILIFTFIFTGKGRMISRIEGALLIMIYIVFMICFF